MRASRIVLLALIGLIGGCLFLLKYEVQRLEAELDALNAALAEDQQAIHVLSAEWSHLNQPARLHALSEQLLDLSALQPEAVAGWKELPPRFDSRLSNAKSQAGVLEAKGGRK